MKWYQTKICNEPLMLEFCQYLHTTYVVPGKVTFSQLSEILSTEKRYLFHDAQGMVRNEAYPRKDQPRTTRQEGLVRKEVYPPAKVEYETPSRWPRLGVGPLLPLRVSFLTGLTRKNKDGSVVSVPQNVNGRLICFCNHLTAFSMWTEITRWFW